MHNTNLLTVKYILFSFSFFHGQSRIECLYIGINIDTKKLINMKLEICINLGFKLYFFGSNLVALFF